MVEFLIEWWQEQPEPDVDYVEGLKKRANQIRDEIAVYSTYA